MDRTVLARSVVVFAAGGCAIGMSRPDFSGTWVLDLPRSSLEIPSPDSSIFVIDHAEPNLIAERTHFLDGVANRSGSRLTSDSVLHMMRAGGLEIPTRMYWDGQTLVLDQEWNQGDVRVANVVRYSLADDGRTMTADEHMSAGDVAHHNVWVFRKR
jgi:hypothetical protein